MNTTYASKINPRFDNAGVQDVSANLSVAKAGLDVLVKQNENELNALRNIAQDQAQIDFNRGAAELVDKYGTDFKGLNDAMMKLENDLYGQIKGTHPEMAENLLRQNDSVRLRAVDAAHRKYISDNDRRIKEGTGMLLDSYKMALPDDYANYLDNLRKPAEQKDMNIISQWTNNLDQIDKLLNRRDMNGNYIFDKKTREQKKFLQDYMLDGAKNMIDRFITANDQAGLQDYYQAHLLAPERYMNETGQDRDTYDKVKKYAEDQLKRMDVEAKDLKFKQSVEDAMGLWVKNTPQKVQQLREMKILPERVIDGIEQNNVKFDSLDAKEPVLPTNFINISSIIAKWDMTPDATTTDGQIQTMLEANDVLGAIADYADKYGMKPQDVESARNMVLNKALSQQYGQLMKTFGDVSNGMGIQIDNVEESILRLRENKKPDVQIGQEKTDFTGNKDKMTELNRVKYTNKANLEAATAQVRLLDQVFREAYVAARQALESGNIEAIPKIQRAVQVHAAHIKYMYNFNDNDWIAWEADKDHEFHDRIGGGIYRVKEITPQGDIITETIR